jgi:hypothetical protein
VITPPAVAVKRAARERRRHLLLRRLEEERRTRKRSPWTAATPMKRGGALVRHQEGLTDDAGRRIDPDEVGPRDRPIAQRSAPSNATPFRILTEDADAVDLVGLDTRKTRAGADGRRRSAPVVAKNARSSAASNAIAVTNGGIGSRVRRDGRRAACRRARSGSPRIDSRSAPFTQNDVPCEACTDAGQREGRPDHATGGVDRDSPPGLWCTRAALPSNASPVCGDAIGTPSKRASTSSTPHVRSGGGAARRTNVLARPAASTSSSASASGKAETQHHLGQG